VPAKRRKLHSSQSSRRSGAISRVERYLGRKYPADANYPSPPSPDLKIWWDETSDQQNTGHHSKNNHGIFNTTVIQRLLG
jgi:hypothetical protein